MESHRKDVKRKQINRSKIVITQSKIKIEKKKDFRQLRLFSMAFKKKCIEPVTLLGTSILSRNVSHNNICPFSAKVLQKNCKHHHL